MRGTGWLTAMTSLALGACGWVVGIEELDVAAPSDSAPAADASSELPPPPADSGPPRDAGPDGDGGASSKRVFVTSDTRDGDIGSSAVATVDAICNAAAARAKLGGTWVAWFSAPGTDAVDRIPEGRYALLDGRPVASDRAQLVLGNLTSPIDVLETGAPATGEAAVWTGTAVDGKRHANCGGNWTTNSAIAGGTAGRVDRKDGAWTDTSSRGSAIHTACNVKARLYCFEL